MLVKIPETGVIGKQEFDIKQDVSIIYGYNNCGKTTILRALDQAFQYEIMRQFIYGMVRDLAIYIPTNRIVISENNTDALRLNDYEDFIHYQKDSYKDYSLHLKRLRDQLLKNKMVHHFICHAVYEIFNIDIKEICSRYSDGIENIINIYLNVIWAMTWNLDITGFTEERLREFLAEQQIYIMIDEIEMFLHVNIQSKLISNLKKDFARCRFILTTHSPLLLTRYKNCMIKDIEKYFWYKADGEIAVCANLDEDERKKADYMIKLYSLNREELVCKRREFMRDLMSDDEFFEILKKKDESSQNIIFLSVFAYYKKQEVASDN